MDARRHLGHGLLHRSSHDCAIRVAGVSQAEQQLQHLGAGGGLQHVEAIQQHQVDARQPSDGDGDGQQGVGALLLRFREQTV